MSTSFALKKISTFALVLELDCPAGSGKLTFDCKVKTKPQITELQDKGLSDAEYFNEIVTGVHGAPGPDGEELTGQAAMDWVLTGDASMWVLPGFIAEYFEQYGDARRKNGRKLPRR